MSEQTALSKVLREWSTGQVHFDGKKDIRRGVGKGQEH